MKTRIVLEVIGNDEELKSFIKLCQYIQSFGTHGMNRTIHVTIDGDGSGHLRFIDGASKNDFPNISLADLHKIEDTLGEYNFDIGE